MSLLFASSARGDNLISGRPDFGLPIRSQPVELAVAGTQALPREARWELYALYQAYIGVVNKRRGEQRWHINLLSGEIIEHPDDPLLPARQVEEAIKKREAEIKALEAQVKQEQLDAPPPPAARTDIVDWTAPAEPEKAGPTQAEKDLKAKKKELKKLKRQYSRSKGLALDWSDAVWAELTALGMEHWSVLDQARTAAPRHTAAVLCAPAEDPHVCFAFDPWKTGRPDVYEFKSWDDGSFDDPVPPEYFLHHLPDKPREDDHE